MHRVMVTSVTARFLGHRLGCAWFRSARCSLRNSRTWNIDWCGCWVVCWAWVVALNLNVITGNPSATPDDFAGFPVMHYMDSVNCIPITLCYKNPYQLAPNDVAALSRLYPAGTSGKSAPTARIHGSVYFVNHFGGPGQPMQGVNVFLRFFPQATGSAR